MDASSAIPSARVSGWPTPLRSTTSTANSYGSGVRCPDNACVAVDTVDHLQRAPQRRQREQAGMSGAFGGAEHRRVHQAAQLLVTRSGGGLTEPGFKIPAA